MNPYLLRIVIAWFFIALSIYGCDKYRGSDDQGQTGNFFSKSLTISVSGNGVVRNFDSPDPNYRYFLGKIDCGILSTGTPVSMCSDTYGHGVNVTLYAFPNPGWVLGRWCNGLTQPSITITMTAPTSCDVQFVIDPAYAFTLSLTPSVLTVIPGTTGDVTATLARGANFAGFPVTLSLVNPPPGVTMVATPNPVAGDSSTLTIQVDAAVSPGQQIQLAIRAEGTNGNGDSVERTVFLTLTVPGTDFNISLGISTLDLVPGESGVSPVTISRAIGFTTDIVLTISGLPQGVTASFAPNPASSTSSQLTVATDGSAPLGTYPITVTGSAGTLIRTASMTLRLVATQTFDISAVQPSITITQGGRLDPATPLNITRHPLFIGGIDFTISGVPPGVLITFDPNPATGNTTNLAIAVSPTAILGNYPLTIMGSGGGLTRQTAVTLTIAAGQQVCPWVAAADSYVGPLVQPSIAATQPLKISSSSLSTASKAYLTFDTRPGYFPQTFTRVELVLMLLFKRDDLPAGTRRVLDVYGITDNNDWDLSTLPEDAIAWNNAPKNDTTSPVDFINWGGSTSNSSRYLSSISVEQSDEAGTLYRINVTDYVRWAIGQDPTYSTFVPTQDQDRFLTIMIGNRSVYNDVPDDDTWFVSRSVPVGCGRPHLEVY